MRDPSKSRLAMRRRRERLKMAGLKQPQWKYDWRIAESKRKPERKTSRMRVIAAVRSGRLVRPERCEACGIDCYPDAHHEDYSKPLEVRWLCRPCHGLTRRREA
jgi:hypothetical protein